ncbi:MAG: phosphatidylglycerophosphatase A [Sulfurospirillaceae bacterium]|nr:phosphatidylglycerophosphatase A [Sulfurospirillaceae bacterium]MDD3462627.1 phosphatidylglycerophosphatase A [Sulfurospirillaceae bacterium]
MQKAFLTFFYTGLSPYAPGTVGSLLGVIAGVLILTFLHPSTLFLLTILIVILGIKHINIYEKTSNTHDDKTIVIDEVAGVWIALLISHGTLTQAVLSFAFFRIFDIWKPSIIGKIDTNVKGGLGVMGDDIVAGIVAGICSAGVWQFILKFL